MATPIEPPVSLFSQPLVERTIPLEQESPSVFDRMGNRLRSGYDPRDYGGYPYYTQGPLPEEAEGDGDLIPYDRGYPWKNHHGGKPRVNGRKDGDKFPTIYNGDPVEALSYTESPVCYMTQTVSYSPESLRQMDRAAIQQCLVAFKRGITSGTSDLAKGFIANMERVKPEEWQNASTGDHYLLVARNFCLYMTPATS